MKKKLMITFLLLLIVLVVMCIKTLINANNSKEISVDGYSVEVAAYSLPTPLHIRPIYEPRDDLDLYPWLRALLFQFNGFGLTVPQAEWANYAEGKWFDERYEGIVKYNEWLRNAISKEPERWEGAVYEIVDIVHCKTDEAEFLSFYLRLKTASGEYVPGGRYKRLKKVNGVWKKPFDTDKGEMARLIGHSYDSAMQLTKENALKVRPVSRLK